MDTDGDAMGGGGMDEREIGERIALIESMMQEGRRRTEYWGWSFLLWGVACLVAIALSSYLPYQPARQFSWPVTMILAVLLTSVISHRRTHDQPQTDKSRHVGDIWSAGGTGIMLFAFSLASSGHREPHSFMAGIEILLGVINIAAGRMLRWTVQTAVGALWWLAAVTSCFVSDRNVVFIFLAALMVCNIGFGIYLMVRESRDKSRARATGAQQHG